MGDELDGDGKGLMNSKGQYAKRDIVQFVPMNKYKNLNDLSKQTLLEIPRQFLSYTKAHNIAPGKKQKAVPVQFAMTEDDMKNNDDENAALQSHASNYNPSMDPYSNAPLPSGWERGYDETGRPYYVDNVNHKTQWLHPAQPQ